MQNNFYAILEIINDPDPVTDHDYREFKDESSIRNTVQMYDFIKFGVFN